MVNRQMVDALTLRVAASPHHPPRDSSLRMDGYGWHSNQHIRGENNFLKLRMLYTPQITRISRITCPIAMIFLSVISQILREHVAQMLHEAERADSESTRCAGAEYLWSKPVWRSSSVKRPLWAEHRSGICEMMNKIN